MILFVIGTTAEAIKLQPIWLLLVKERIDFQIVSLGQHTRELEELITGYGLQLYFKALKSKSKDNLLDKRDAVIWILSSFIKLFIFLRNFERQQTLIFVQGDTFSTVVGSVLGKSKKMRVIHLEAGLRSHNFRSPFPEEINRRIVSKIANFHFCPGIIEVNNLLEEGVTPERISLTGGNTSLDHFISSAIEKNQSGIKYGLVTLHRQELLEDPELFAQTVDSISKSSLTKKILFFCDHRSKRMLSQENNIFENITFHNKLSHSEFIKVLAGAEWVITDSGGIQEECAYLGTPTLVHRVSTERYEGVGENILISGWEIDKIVEFLRNYETYKRDVSKLQHSPSLKVIEDLRLWELI